MSFCGGNKDDDTLGGRKLGLFLVGVGGVSVEVVGMEAVLYEFVAADAIVDSTTRLSVSAGVWSVCGVAIKVHE
jgi:hypothetical protein